MPAISPPSRAVFLGPTLWGQLYPPLAPRCGLLPFCYRIAETACSACSFRFMLPNLSDESFVLGASPHSARFRLRDRQHVPQDVAGLRPLRLAATELPGRRRRLLIRNSPCPNSALRAIRKLGSISAVLEAQDSGEHSLPHARLT